MKHPDKSNPLIYLLAKAWRYSAGNRTQVTWYWAMFIVANSLWIFAQPFFWATIINVVQASGVTQQSLPKLVWLLVGLIAINVVFWSIHGPARVMERRNAFKARMNYRYHLLSGILRLPLEWHSEHHSGDSIDKIEKGTTSLYNFSASTFEIINGGVQLVGSYAVLAYFSPPAALIVAVMILVTMWITIRFDRVLIGQYRAINHAENSISESVFDVVSNISTVIILRVERVVFETIMRKVEHPYSLVNRNNTLNEWKWFLTNMCCTVMTVLVLVVYFWQHLGTKGGILVGSTYLLIQYLGRMSDLFYKFTTMYGDVVQRRANVANAEELSADFRPGNLTNHVLPAGWRTLDIAGLDFAYGSEGSGLNLNNASLSLTRGERVAFVGETGSGKTTMLKIMRDLYHPQKLSLAVDGTPLAHGFEGISRAIALVPQDPEIFSTTVLENITLGVDYDSAFVRRFTDMACFTDVIEGLPQGINSSIKEKGVNLSGGQQQRLALSRGLLACHDKDVVLLDEPTSSLDAMTEMRVYANIFREFKGKTIVSSIHRLHLLQLFDRICLFEKGRIVASGTLAELLASSPQFQVLWATMQHV